MLLLLSSRDLHIENVRIAGLTYYNTDQKRPSTAKVAEVSPQHARQYELLYTCVTFGKFDSKSRGKITLFSLVT